MGRGRVSLRRRWVSCDVLYSCYPCPWFVRRVVSKAVLWATPVHLMAFFPEFRAVSVIARVGFEAIDAFVVLTRYSACVSFVRASAFRTVRVVRSAAATLVAKSLASETSDGLFAGSFGFHSFVKDIRTLFEDGVG